jgi:hypothetical protein
MGIQTGSTDYNIEFALRAANLQAAIRQRWKKWWNLGT